jgi:hypothetical protein
MISPVEVRDFAVLLGVQTGFETHPASYSMATGVSFPDDKASDA